MIRLILSNALSFQIILGLFFLHFKTKAQITIDLQDGLIAYYPFTGNAADSSGNANDGVPANGASLTTDRFGNSNSAYLFDGVDDYIKVSNASVLNNTNYTYSWWAKLNALPGNGESSNMLEIGSEYNIGYPPGQVFAVNNNYVSTTGWRVTSGNSDGTNVGFQTGTLPNAGEWYHVLVTRSDDTVRLYINGEEVVNGSTGGLAPYYDSNLDIYIGSRSTLTLLQYFDGVLDDIRFYDRVVNQCEILALYMGDPINLDSGLVAYYSFTGNAADSSGNFNDGVPMNGVSLTTDRFGNANSAYLFDGVNDYIKIANASILNNTNYTYSWWAKLNTLPGNGESSNMLEIGSEYNTGYPPGQVFAVNNNYVSTTGWRVTSGNSDGSSVGFQTDTLPNDNEWYHVVVTRGDDFVTLYINAEEVMSEPTNGLSPYYDNNLDVYIGSRSTLTLLQYFNGVLDDIRFYDRVVSECEIQNIYHENQWMTSVENKTLINNNEVIIYPNPSKGIFTIRLKNPAHNDIYVNVVNMLGQDILKEKQGYEGKEELKLNLLNFEKGIYFLNLEIGNFSIIKKVIIM